MKVFISWSGDLSHALALALRDWLPSVVQSVRPFVSSEDIESGARWSNDIGCELEATTFGLLCVTRESVNAPWLNFEAGALSKSMGQARVVPLLFRMRKSEIKGPLVQFNMRGFEKQELKSVIETINNACADDKLDQERLNEAFDIWWPKLESKISPLTDRLEAAVNLAPKASEANAQVLEEILDLVRSQQKILNNPEVLLPPDYLRHVTRSARPRGEFRAVDDLISAWRSLVDLTLNVGPDQSLPSRLVYDHIVRMERPLSYILDRRGFPIDARALVAPPMPHRFKPREVMARGDEAVLEREAETPD